MKVFRIAREEYIKDLAGTGAKLYGGRWNPKGIAVLYTAENKSLSALEVLVHFNRNTTPYDLRILTLQLPSNEIVEFDKKKFNKILSSEDSNFKFKEEGRKWIESNNSLGLKVPSVLIPGEYNILINPSYTTFNLLKIVEIEIFKFDERFLL